MYIYGTLLRRNFFPPAAEIWGPLNGKRSVEIKRSTIPKPPRRVRTRCSHSLVVRVKGGSPGKH